MRTAVIAFMLVASAAAHAQRAGQSPEPAAPAAPATASETAKHVDAGAALYKKKGCYECHVNDAQGGPQGPRLGPNPIPLPRFTTYIRNPTGDMPPFTEKVLSNQELADIYAFLQARPQPKPVNSIPLLAP
jgi:ubiquinol-cytochrome c reductase cytochrome c subunit